MFPMQVYVVGVYEHERASDKYNVSLRLEKADGTYLSELSISMSDVEAEPWKALVGKTSAVATLNFAS